MGSFSVALQVGDLAGGQFVQVLGITAMDRFTYSLADETVVEYDVGEARLRLDGRERTTQVVFGPQGVTPLLGATTLRLFHLGVDPLQEKLTPVTGMLKQLRQEVNNLAARLEALESL